MLAAPLVTIWHPAVPCLHMQLLRTSSGPSHPISCSQVQRYAEAYMDQAWGTLKEACKDTPAGLTEGKAVSLTKEKVQQSCVRDTQQSLLT